jgi:transposase InsO family protein
MAVPEGPWFCAECLTQDTPALQPPLVPTPNSASPEQSTPEPSDEEEWSDSFNSDADSLQDDDADRDTLVPKLEIWNDPATLEYLQNKHYNIELLSDNDCLRKKELKRIEKRTKTYFWNNDDNKLYYKPTDKYPVREVPPPDNRDAIIDQIHQDVGHLGPRKMCSVLMQRYYWRNMTSQIKNRLQACDNCMRHKTLFKIQPELRPIPPTRLWERVNLDSMGPYAPTRAGSRYICVGIDAFSKYCECWPVPKINSETMSRFVSYHILANHGCPKVIITDQGREFQFGFESLMRQLGIEHIRSAAYNPQSNGQAEAAVKTILHGLQKAVGDNPHSWDEKLPSVILGLRTAVHSTTGFSPFFINTGRHPVLPTERRNASATVKPAVEDKQAQPPATPARKRRSVNEAGPSSSSLPPVTTAAAAAAAAAGANSLEPADSDEDLDSTAELLDEGTRQLVKERKAQKNKLARTVETNILRSQKKQMADFSCRHLPTSPEDLMPPGSLVLLFVPHKTKLHRTSCIEGPYRLVEYLSNAQALVEERDGKRWQVAIKRLAPFPNNN